MNDYLAIIRKLDFIDLFKYGQLSISYAIPFDGRVLEHTNDVELFEKLTERMNMYEYSFEYLIIHFKANDYNYQYISIDIRNVCALYTFDEDAKKEMSISFDPRIQLHVSPWADKFEELQRKLSIKQSQRGINNLWTIFDLPKEDFDKCSTIITPSIVQEVFRELYSNERPSGEQSIWTYLLRYERHSFYPKGMKGFFCDFIHVFCNYSKKQELSGEVAEETQLGSQIKACIDSQFAPLIEIVKASQLYKLTEDVSGCRFAIAAPLFLFLKDKFADGIEHKPEKEFIDYTKKIGGFECSIAIYLLGLSLGYDKTYDSFYESAKLAFFKKVIPSNTPSNTIVTRNSSISNQEDSKGSANGSKKTAKAKKSYQGTIQFPEEKIDEPQKNLPIQWMKKKQDVRPVYDEEEKSKLNKLKYTPVKQFNSIVMNAISTLGFDPNQEKLRFTKSKSSKTKK